MSEKKLTWDFPSQLSTHNQTIIPSLLLVRIIDLVQLAVKQAQVPCLWPTASVSHALAPKIFIPKAPPEHLNLVRANTFPFITLPPRLS